MARGDVGALTGPPRPRARVGTSGWSYPEWVGPFYPPGTPAGALLPYYADRFPTVEAHGTFRRRPDTAALARWAAQVPEDFRFAPKAHLGITHRRDLEGVEERAAAFLQGLEGLGSRLGPVLLQLPHRRPDLSRLDRLLAGWASTRPGVPVPVAAFELAPAWHTREVLDRLERAGAAMVLVDREGGPPPLPAVGPVVYLRLRRPSYGAAQLDAWVERLAGMVAGGRDVYAYVRHDAEGRAPGWAAHLRDGLATRGG